ncbi:hypothetical protein [Oribacterium sp. P6A1]|uniref:hypothetical protein n=1 Tax=Oribacterium sp. P6A1 TaxID=1410612 RepID=UPI00056003E5|nr:hypothetical protein [Oribacterium sp. P6A1]
MATTKTSKSIGIRRDKKYPSKKYINLMYKEKKVRNIAFSLSLFAVYLVLLYFFTKYGVYRELSKADNAERIYAEKLHELQELQEKNNEFMDVRTEYSRYGNSYMTDEESAAQDMVTMLNIIDERIHEKGAIQSVNVSGNVAEIKLGIADANRLPEIIRSLEESEYISYVTAQTASTVEQNYNKVTVDEEGNVIAPQYVDASITVYFRSPEEVTNAVSSGSETVDAYLDASPTGQAVGDNAYVPYIMETVAPETEDGTVAEEKSENSKSENSSSKNSSSKNNSSGSSSKSGSTGNSSGSTGSSSKSSSKSSSNSSAQAAAQQQAAAQAAAQQQAWAAQQQAAAQTGGSTSAQNVYIDTPSANPFGSGSVSIQSGSPWG